MKKYYVWKLVDGKKKTVVQMVTDMPKEELRARLISLDVEFDGIDSVNAWVR